ncbi:MAG: stage V sporulation protein R [Chloroflexi bacterium]|nr:MAG: stage V sporulation protein R [Chloroflexota bacterium]
MARRSDPDLARLRDSIEQIWEIAQRLGLRPFPTHFELVPAAIMYEFGSYGMPGRFSHWTHGKLYQTQKTMYDYGLSKIYELVINTNPCWAFLLESNTVLQNEFVVAHVLGHSDFFANNAYYQRTSRRMIDTVTLNAERLRRYEYQFGMERVEQLLDAVISIEEHVDPFAETERRERPATPARRQSAYDDLWEPVMSEDQQQSTRLPARDGVPTPCRDLLLFLARESPILEDWERDVVEIVRGEMLYFYPQMQTKIINEGWASYWHVQIMRELDLSSTDHLEFAALHSSVLQPHPGRLNPYYLGFTILNDVERRFNALDGSGRERLFQLRETECDVSLVRNYLTEELVSDLDLFYAERRSDALVITEKQWEAVRDRLVEQISDFGIPTIHALDADYNGNRELLLRHEWNGRDLDLSYAEKTLEGVEQLWGRKVWLETRENEGNPLLLSYSRGDGHARRQAAA